MKFIGDVVTKWLRDEGEADRNMQLLEDFAFEDGKGVVWKAPKGCIINGASIPKTFWKVTGPPYVGDYRRASVVHDYECIVQQRPHKAVHRMFYDAMRCDGVSKFKAFYMYKAVRLFGPKWGSGPFKASVLDTVKSMNTFSFIDQPVDIPTFTEDDLLDIDTSLTIDELEKQLDDLLGE